MTRFGKLCVLLLLLFTAGAIFGNEYGHEVYVYYYPDNTYSGTFVGHCADNDGCTGYDYCAGDTSTNYRLWETFRCGRGQGGCHCEEKIDGSWVVVTCPSTSACV